MIFEDINADIFEIQSCTPCIEANVICIGSGFNIIGGYYGHNFVENQTSKKKSTSSGNVCRITFKDDDVSQTENAVDYTNLVGSTTVTASYKQTSITFGGWCVNQPSPNGEFINYLSDALILHQWNKDGTFDRKNRIPSPIKDEEDKFKVQWPSPRIFHGSCWDPIHDKLWIFGGDTIASNDNKYKTLQDIWIWDNKTNEWTSIPNLMQDFYARSVTYLNGHIYILAGHIIATKIYDIDITKLDDIVWSSIPIPDIYQVPIHGSKLFVCKSLLLNDYIFISPGIETDMFPAILQQRNIATHTYVQGTPLCLTAYCLNTKSFSTYKFVKSIPQTTYHTIFQDNLFIYFLGGIVFNDQNSSYFKKIIRIKKSHLFSHESTEFIKNFREISTKTIPEIEFLPVLHEIIKENISKAPFTDNFNVFMRQQKYPILDFKKYIFISNLLAEKQIITARFGSWTDSFAKLPTCFIRDLFVYAYTDWIEIRERKYDFESFLLFIQYLRENKAYRLIWLEIIENYPQFTFEQVIELSCMRRGDVILADDKELSIVKCILFEVLNTNLPKIATLGNLLSLSSLHDYAMIINAVKTDTPIVYKFDDLKIPEGTIIHDLALIRNIRAVECFDGMICVNTESLPDINFKKYKANLVRAVLSHKTKGQFSKIDGIYQAFEMINSSKNAELNLIKHIFHEDRAKIKKELLKNSKKLFQTLFEYKPCLIQYILNLIGRPDVLTTISGNNCSLKISKICPVMVTSKELKCNVNQEDIYGLALLFYSNLDFDSVNKIYQKKSLSDALLSLITNNFDAFSEENLNKIKEFVIKESISDEEGKISSELFAKNFVTCFNANIHQECAKKCPDDKWITILSQNYANQLDKRMLTWIFSMTTKESEPHLFYEESIENFSEKVDNSFVWVNE